MSAEERQQRMAEIVAEIARIEARREQRVRDLLEGARELLDAVEAVQEAVR